MQPAIFSCQLKSIIILDPNPNILPRISGDEGQGLVNGDGTSATTPIEPPNFIMTPLT